ncbi:MAG: DUF1573 domain-containing protein [Planctomycetes bacterium]|nr:DUF1573 domain-containing protein [Planctomycetota bacterium]
MADASQRRLMPRLMAAGMLIPFTLAVAAYVSGSKPTPISPPASRGALVFDQYLVDLGHVPPSQDVAGYFDFTNRGKHPVEITALEPSCGCLRPRLEKLDRRGEARVVHQGSNGSAPVAPERVEKRIYEPGEDGFFSVRVQTANQSPGPKDYTVKVKYNDPEPRETVVTFRAVLPEEQVLVRPIALMFYQLGSGSGDSAPQTFEVIDRRKEHLKIVKIDCSRPDVKITPSTSEVDEDGSWHGRFDVTVPNELPPGQAEAIVRVHTDDPADQYHVLRIPITLVGPPPRGVNSHILQTGGTMPIKPSDARKKKTR